MLCPDANLECGTDASLIRFSFYQVLPLFDRLKILVAVGFYMALVRILVDGYSLLHSWPELAPGKPRFSAAARDELIHRLTLYQDAAGIPLTIVFDGANTDIRLSTIESTPKVEILYSRAGQTADQVIERAAHRLSAYGEVAAAQFR